LLTYLRRSYTCKIHLQNNITQSFWFVLRDELSVCGKTAAAAGCAYVVITGRVTPTSTENGGGGQYGVSGSYAKSDKTNQKRGTAGSHFMFRFHAMN
jgi:hypothetical protein